MGFTPLWECFELARNLDCEIKNPGFEPRNAISGEKEMALLTVAVLCEFSFWKSQPSVISSFQMCHKNVFHTLETCVSLTMCACSLWLSPFSFWSYFHFVWIAAISRLIWLCGHDQKEQESFRVWGLPQEKEKSSLKFNSITTFIWKSVKPLSNSQSKFRRLT